MTAQQIFKEYSDKYHFLRELSKQEKAIIICMFIENYKQGYKDGKEYKKT